MRFFLKSTNPVHLLLALCVSMIMASMGTFQAVYAQGIGLPSSESSSSNGPNYSGTVSNNPELKNDCDDQGMLVAFRADKKALGFCPLEHTDISAQVSGYVAIVTVKQIFQNPFKDRSEAVYTFPLSDNSAVDEMFMQIGRRLIHGKIKERGEAKRVYESAKTNGQTAALLEQERSNVFTQSVANIQPGDKTVVTLKYVELLPYADGKYTISFPTVVGPRFMPGNTVVASKSGTGWSVDTVKVPDASRISPTIAQKNCRSGHDISISVAINAGIPCGHISSKLHEIVVERKAQDCASITLKAKDAIPNRDFVVSWDVASDSIKSGCLFHKESDRKPGYFTLMMLPPKQLAVDKIAPKEMIFLIDCSGSQAGPPLDKAKETLNYILDHMNPQDTFQIIAFSNEQNTLFDKPQSASPFMLAKAKVFVAGLSGDGGTWMAPAVESACKIPPDDHRLRIVTFMTDGYVGNDLEILGMIRKYRGTSRWFSFGTGNLVNHMLIDGIAQEGGGEAEYVLLNSPGAEIAQRFYSRISSPVLTDLKVSFDGSEINETYPAELTDLWAQRPVYIKGRYLRAGKVRVRLSGFRAGKPYSENLTVNFPAIAKEDSGVASIWARAKVDQLLSEDYFGAQSNSLNEDLKQKIIATAVEHHIMTKYTSFVAVDETPKSIKGDPKIIPVAVEMPDGVQFEIGASDTYRGLHQWFKDDLVGNLFSNISQLVGKWLSEFIDGICASTVETLSGILYSFTVSPVSASDFWRIILAVYAIASQLVVAGSIIVRIGKGTSTAKSNKSGFGFSTLLNNTTIILLAWPWLCFLMVQITERFSNWVFQLGPSEACQMQFAFAQMVRGCVIAAGAGCTNIFAPLLANLAIPVLGQFVGQVCYFAAIIVFTLLIGILIVQVLTILALQVFRTVVLILQYISAPFLVLFMFSERRDLPQKFTRAFLEVNLWTISWMAILKLVMVVLFATLNPWGKLIIVLAALQLMVQLPALLARTAFGPLFKYVSTIAKLGMLRHFTAFVKGKR